MPYLVTYPNGDKIIHENKSDFDLDRVASVFPLHRYSPFAMAHLPLYQNPPYPITILRFEDKTSALRFDDLIGYVSDRQYHMRSLLQQTMDGAENNDGDGNKILSAKDIALIQEGMRMIHQDLVEARKRFILSENDAVVKARQEKKRAANQKAALKRKIKAGGDHE